VKILLFLVSLFSVNIMDAVDRLTIPENVLISKGLDVAFVARFALFLAVLLGGTLFFGKILKKLFRLPVIAGQITGGIILGPSLINIKQFAIFQEPLKLVDSVTQQVYLLSSSDLFIFVVLLISAALTVSYLLWIAGHETDIKDILKVGVTATGAGILGALMPIGMLVAVEYLLWPSSFSLVSSIGMGLIFAATSVSIPVAMLVAQKKMHLKTSKATLGAAIIDDIFAVVLLSIFNICLQTGIFGGHTASVGHSINLPVSLGYMLAAFILFFLFGHYVLPKITRWFQQKDYLHLIAPFANIVMMAYFAGAELFGGLAGITGAYFAGLFYKGADTSHRAEKTISPYLNSVLLPLFLGSIGLQVDISVLTLGQWGVACVFLLVAMISKIVGCYAATILANLSGTKNSAHWSWLEGFIFGSSMIARGEVGLVIATILNGAAVITQEQYIICVVVIVLTTIATPIMLSIGFAMQDAEAEASELEEDYILNLGVFNTFGTSQMFNIILGIIDQNKSLHSNVQLSEGRMIASLEGQNVKIILTPGEGIIFEGNRKNIENLIKMIKTSIASEISRLTH